MGSFWILGDIPLDKLGLIKRIKLQLGLLFLWAAMKLIPRPFWEEFGVQAYGETVGGRAKEYADERHAELEARLADYIAGHGSGEWPPKADKE